MVAFHAEPVLREVHSVADERRRVLRALALAQEPHEADTHRADLASLDSRLGALWNDPRHRPIISEALTERASALRIVVAARREDANRAARAAHADALVHRAIAHGRSLTAAEAAEVRDLESEKSNPSPGWRSDIASAAIRDSVLADLGSLRLRQARAQLRNGLLLTEQMIGIIREGLPAVLRGDPVLLVGETGGAKTALSEHLARRAKHLDPEFISGYGDITSAQVIGTHELRTEGGATVSAFVPGPLLRAMTEGRPVILDEINAMPAEFLKRLNRLLQLRPGDSFSVQEDTGRSVEIAPGFSVLATANEQTPHRYRGLDRLSAELVNRFGANAYRVHYPDAGRAYEEFPTENALLATAAVVDSRGELPPGISVDELLRVARAAFISQQVFSGEHGEGFRDYVSTDREIDGRPGLEESVLAPRTLVAVLEKVAGSAGSVSLDRALARFVEGIMHREDRRVLSLILRGQGFRLE